jgi:hypothetical protein
MFLLSKIVSSFFLLATSNTTAKSTTQPNHAQHKHRHMRKMDATTSTSASRLHIIHA